MQTRREWIKTAGMMATGLAFNGAPARAAEDRSAKKLKIGMCDWSLNRTNVSSFELAKQIGLDGVQVSVGDPESLFLRDPKVQREYLDASKKTGVAIAATAMGLLNHIPFMSEPKMSLWTADAIEITKALGTQVMLLAFFPPHGELKEENKEDMRRTIEALKELGPRAARAGVILGLEDYLTAEANLGIIEQVKSPAVQVYYDAYNSWVTKGHDPVKEIEKIGPRVCQVHLKEGQSYLGESGKIDWPAVAGALQKIKYKGWLILETLSPSQDIVKDAQRNIEYVRKTFAGLA